tara:strand:+ start:3300 stop:3887 length:588 start_codon:yes stop_codon:yes gene_type:complete
MVIESVIRNYVRGLLLEKEEEEPPTTTGPGPGRFKKELKDLKALADVDPAKLMSNLNISDPGGDTEEASLESILKSAVGGTSEMKAAYGSPSKKSDSADRIGYSIPVTGEGMSPRDGLVFIREAFKGAKSVGYWTWDKDIQIELLGGDILAYVSESPFTWNKAKKAKKAKKDDKPGAEKDNKPDAEKDNKPDEQA